MISVIDLSIILPALNEEAIIADTIDKLVQYLKKHPEFGKYELIVVAAGSDKTAQIAHTFDKQTDSLSIITPSKRMGKGCDVRLGFQAARGNLQLFIDADLSTPLEHIASMIKLLQTDYDIVIGKRSLGKIHKSILRTMLSVASNWLIRLLILRGISDSQCGFKGFRSEAARKLFTDDMRINGWAFDVEILVAAKKMNYRIVQLSIADWQETRQDDLRSERLAFAALYTLRDVLSMRLSLWFNSLLRHTKYIIGLTAISSFCLSLWIGSQQSIWFDEAYSANLIKYPIGKLIRLTSVDVHPPLYYLLLKGWAALFGSNDIALRSFSCLCGALAVIFGLLLIQRLWDARTTLFVAPFMLAAPFLLRYNFEIRMYALASMLSILATYVLVVAIKSNNIKQRRRLWIFYTLLITAGMYTLYYTVFVWVAHFIWCIYISRSDRPKIAWHKLFKQPWLLAYAGALLLYLPWVPSLISQLHASQSMAWIGPATYRQVINVWSFFFSYSAEWQLTPWRSFIFMLAFASAIYFVVTAFRISSRINRQNLVLLILYVTMPIVLLYCLSLPPLHPKFVERYYSQCVLSAYLLLGVVIAIVLKHRRALIVRVVALGLLAVLVQGVFTLHSVGNYNFEQLYKPNVRQVSEYLQNNVAPNEPIVTADPYDYMQYHYYLPGDNVLFYSANPVGFSGGYAMLHNSPLRVYSKQAFAHQSVWIEYNSQTPPYIPLNHVLSLSTRFDKVQVDLYTVIPPHS